MQHNVLFFYLLSIAGQCPTHRHLSLSIGSSWWESHPLQPVVEWCWQPPSAARQRMGIWSAALVWQVRPDSYRCFGTHNTCRRHWDSASRLSSAAGGVDNEMRLRFWHMGEIVFWAPGLLGHQVGSDAGASSGFKGKFMPNSCNNKKNIHQKQATASGKC